MDKRTFLRSVFLGSAGLMVTSFGSKLKAAKTKIKWNGVFKLPELGYALNALEPYIDAQTMELHHSKLHADYTSGFNATVSESGLTGKTAFEMLSEVSKYPSSIRSMGGGYLNHKLFWKMLAPAKGQQPSTELMKMLIRDFDSFDGFKDRFSSAAESVSGSGWVWLIIADRKLRITTTSNHDNPMMDIAVDKGVPLLCLDLWEHAYHTMYRDKRTEYVEAFWNVVNWDFVSLRYARNKDKITPFSRS